MALSDKINLLHTAVNQQNDVIAAIAIIKSVVKTVNSANVRLQSLKDSGSFNTIDNEVKTALVNAAALITSADTALSDASVTDLYGDKIVRVCQSCGIPIMKNPLAEPQ